MKQLHLDFHTPDFVKVGEAFDATEFFDTIEATQIDCLTVFAKCHHGNCYFDTQVGRRHPGLSFDLLGEMCKEASKRNISLLVYFSMNVDEFTAMQHPDWVAMYPDKKPVNSQVLACGSELYWNWLCTNRGPYLEEVFFPQVEQVLENYLCDGIFVDMAAYLPGSCHCHKCNNLMQEQGLNPASEADHSLFNTKQVQQITRELRCRMDAIKPGLRLEIATFNCFDNINEGEKVVGEFYIEALPNQGGWFYLPFTARYFRKSNALTLGMTSRFLKNWGDFGTIKSGHQLKMEVSMHLMAGIHSCVGDHLHCNGKLDKAAYKVISEAFQFLDKRQSFCIGGEFPLDVSIIAPKQKLANAAIVDENGDNSNNGIYGASKILAESHYNWDVLANDATSIESKILILTHSSLGSELKNSVKNWVKNGGSLIVSFASMLTDDTQWLDFMGIRSAKLSEHPGAFYKILAKKMRNNLPDTPHYAYSGHIEVELEECAEALASILLPPCIRSRGNFYGHFHGCDYVDGTTAVFSHKIGKGQIIGITPDIFGAYYKDGYIHHQTFIKNILALAIPDSDRIFLTNAPSQVEITLSKKNRQRVIQLLPFFADRKSPHAFESYNEKIMLHDIWVDLPLEGASGKAVNPVTGQSIQTIVTSQRVRIMLGPFSEHTVILLS